MMTVTTTTPEHTHSVYQTAPDGTVVEAKFWDAEDRDVAAYARQMREDNRDCRYAVARMSDWV